ncbi:MAG: VWA domain-containing protein, partial [Gemmatimonadota bacterium]
LKLRNLLLLILRTLVIILLVLAAARPVVGVGGGTSHPPTAVALVLDNSLSARAVVDGRRTLDVLVEAAHDVLAQLGPGDRLWLVLADGIPRRLSRPEALVALDSVGPTPLRMDLSAAVRAAANVLADDDLEWTELVVLSDLQASAFSPGDPIEIPILLLEPATPPANRWIDSTHTVPDLWSPSGTVVASIGGVDGEPATVRLQVDSRDLARAVASPGDHVALSGRIADNGWKVAAIVLDPDEFRADDRAHLAIQVAEPAQAAAGPGTGQFVREALSVLQQGGRLAGGTDVLLGDGLGPAMSVVFPPADAAMLGALNRSLEARGVDWRFGDLVGGEWEIGGEAGPANGVTVMRRYRLIGDGSVIARTGDEPWLVRQGDVVILGSRMEPEWTALPVTAAFVPFIDLLINQLAARGSWIRSATPGQPVDLPAGVVELAGSAASVPASASRVVAPLQTGVYFMLEAAGDTVGALLVNYDARESRLETADRAVLNAALGSDLRVVGMDRLRQEMFRASRRSELTGLFLVAALVGLLLEFAVASSRATPRSGT